MKNWTRGLAVASASALILSACGAPPEEGSGAGAESDFKACMVSDAGGFDDRSFNQSGAEGLNAAKEDLGIETATAESQSNADFAPNLEQLVNEDCGIIVTVGYLLATATGDAAKAHEDTKFAIIDSKPADAKGDPIELENVKPIAFNTAEASFLAGYLAAGQSESGKVATYGGVKIPSVAIFMDGFVDGVKKYNADNDAKVQVLGWNKEAQEGSFTGDFEDQSKGKALTQGFIEQGADIVMPVAGPVGGGSLAAAKEAEGVSIIWVDSDGVETNPESKDVILTSVTKEIGTAVEDVITATEAENFDSEAYVGTLANEGVGIAPYHEFEDKVDPELDAKVQEIKQQIIDGEIDVTTENAPV